MICKLYFPRFGRLDVEARAWFVELMRVKPFKTITAAK